MLNVVQIQKLSQKPRTTASCCTWFRSMVDQHFIQESVAQLRQLDRAACVLCDTIRSRRCHLHLETSLLVTPFRPTAHHPPGSSQPVPPGDPFDDSTLPNCPIWDVVITERDKQLLVDFRRASAMPIPRCVVSRHATAWAESLEGAIVLGRSMPISLPPVAG